MKFPRLSPRTMLRCTSPTPAHPFLPALLLALLLSVLFLQTQPLNAQHATMFNGDSAAAILHHIAVDIGPRPMGSPAEHRALEFAVAKFKEYGCDTAYIMPFTRASRANTSSGVAVGIKRGQSARAICLGGHMDSAGPEIPGANDDGSGSATVIELARVLAPARHASTLIFCCFGGEEEGLEGSRYFVDHYVDPVSPIDSIALMLQTDMTNGLGVIELDPDTHGASAPQWLVRAAVEEFYGLGYEHLRYPTHFFSLNYAMSEGSGSDHEYFLRRGIPAIDFTTDVTDPIHTPGDNWENFDARGLQRSGDVMMKLVHRFDAGVPPEKTTQYWLFLAGTVPVFVPIGVLWIVYALCLFLGAAGLVKLRRAFRAKRESEMAARAAALIDQHSDLTDNSTPAPPPPMPKRIRWSTLKLFFLSIIIAAGAWFATDLVNLMKGVRHAWMLDYPLYGWLSVGGGLLGLCLAAQLSRVMRITHEAYPLYRNGFILFFLIFCGLVVFGIKSALYPALTIGLFGVGVLVRSNALRVVLLALAPLPAVRVVFSEWVGLIFRSAGYAMPANSPGSATMVQIVVLASATLLVWPFLVSGAALLRAGEFSFSPVRIARSGALLALTAIGLLAFGTFLAQRPSYNTVWKRDARAMQKFSFTSDTTPPVFTNSVQGSEYLKGLNIDHGAAPGRPESDTAIFSKRTYVEITPTGPIDSNWCRLERTAVKSDSGGGTTRINLVLDCKFRPYTVTVAFKSNGKELPSLETPWLSIESRGARELKWYSFPDTHLVIPVALKTAPGDSVTETVSVVFDSLAYPMTLSRELTFFLNRTEYYWERKY